MIQDNNGIFGVGTIVGYTAFESFYGAKILSEIYISEISQYRYLLQMGDVQKGKNDFSANIGGRDLALMSGKEIKDTYPKKWTKGPDLKDGDVLASSGFKHIFVVRGRTSSDRVRLHRVSGGQGLFDSYDNYVNRYGTLVQVKPMFDGQNRFSDSF